MMLRYSRADLARALDIWPHAHGFDRARMVPVETWTFNGFGVVFFADRTTKAEVMRYLRKRYGRDLLGARLFDEFASQIYLSQGRLFPRRKTREEVLEETQWRELAAKYRR